MFPRAVKKATLVNRCILKPPTSSITKDIRMGGKREEKGASRSKRDRNGGKPNTGDPETSVG